MNYQEEIRENVDIFYAEFYNIKQENV